MVAKYRKKPVVVEALQYTGTADNIKEMMKFCEGNYFPEIPTVVVQFGAGKVQKPINPKDYVVKGVSGYFFTYPEEVFLKSYDEIEEESTDITHPEIEEE